jgi:hypothetical protein
MGDEASNIEYAMAIAVLYDASESFGGITYDRAGQVCLAVLEDTYWNDAFGLFVDDPLAETTSVTTSLQVAGMATYAGATGSDVDLAKHRIPELWGGMVGAGLPLSETDATGENYSIQEPDTNNNTIWKHNWSRGTGFMDGPLDPRGMERLGRGVASDRREPLPGAGRPQEPDRELHQGHRGAQAGDREPHGERHPAGAGSQREPGERDPATGPGRLAAGAAGGDQRDGRRARGGHRDPPRDGGAPHRRHRGPDREHH